MNRYPKILAVAAILALVALACNMPGIAPQTTPGANAGATATFTLPPILTMTSPPPGGQPTQAGKPTLTPTAHGDGAACTYIPTFISDVTIPDNTVIPAGQAFVKTWRVRNDGTCSWGTNLALHALAFTNGDQLGAPDEVPLGGEIKPGASVDISVNMKAPAASGTYLSSWLFRLDGDPSGRHWVGIGPKGDQPLYALIKVGANSPSLTRLRFASGATAIAVQGQVNAGEQKGYVLAAMKDQVILATLSSASGTVTVKITASDGASLEGSPAGGTTSAMAKLPSNQDYIVWVTGVGQASNFGLNVTIPSRITFGPGETSASRDGVVSQHMPVSYVLRALAGQTMTVNLTGNDIGLTIWGLQDGTPLIRAVSEAKSFNQKLTVTQDYIIEAVPAVDATMFTMQVTVK